MATVTLRGNVLPLSGELPAVGAPAPAATLTDSTLKDVQISDYAGTKVLNIFPSIDTPVCATSVRTFNARAAATQGVTVLNISADLPFALKRFCGAEGLSGVHTLSTFRGGFADAYGLKLAAGPMAGLCARAVVVVNGEGEVVYSELVPEIAQEPNYDAALAALS